MSTCEPGYGEQVGFFYGWMSFIVIYPGVAAALAVGATPYVAQLLPAGARALAAVRALLFASLPPSTSSVPASAPPLWRL